MNIVDSIFYRKLPHQQILATKSSGSWSILMKDSSELPYLIVYIWRKVYTFTNWLFQKIAEMWPGFSVVVEAIRGHTAYGLVAKRHEIVWPGLSVRKRGHTHVWLG